MLAAAATVVAAPIVVSVLALGGMEPDRIRALLIPLTPLVTGIVAVVVAGIGDGSRRALLGRRSFTVRLLVLAALLGLGAFVGFNVLFGSLVVWILQLVGIDPPAVQESLRSAADHPEALPILVFSTVVVAPIGEELLYRGLLVQAFLNRMGKTATIVASAAIFAVGHAALGVPALSNILLAVLIFPLGILLAWSFLRWGTLWVPIVMHAVFNGITVAVMATGLL